MSEWEETVIGSVLVDHGCIPETSHLSPGDFVVESNKEIWKTILEVQKSGIVTMRTVTETMRENGTLDTIGSIKNRGEAYLEYLKGRADPLSIITSADKVEELSLKRQIGHYAALMSADTKNGKKPEEIIALYTQKLISLRRRKHENAMAIGEMLPEFDERFEGLRQGNMTKVPWYFRIQAIQKIVDFVDQGDFVIIPSRPGGGKSTILRYEALHTAMDGNGVLVLNFENPHDYFMINSLAMLTGINNAKIRDPRNLSEQELEAVAEARGKIINLPLYIKDMGIETIDEVTMFIRSELARHEDIKIIQLDYLQLIRGADSGKYEVVLQAAQQLRSIAQETGIPVIVTSQLKREGYNQSAPRGKRPTMADILYAGEQAAKKIVAPYSQEATESDLMKFPENVDKGGAFVGMDKIVVDVIKFAVLKNSIGKTGDTEEVAYHKHTNDFKTLPREWRRINSYREIEF